MPQQPQLVIAIDTGPEYTPEGERLDLCQEKAFAFTQTWAKFLEDGTYQKPDLVSDIAWNELVDNLYVSNDTNNKRVAILKIFNDVSQMRLCDEAETRTILIKYVTEDRNVNKKSYVDKIISSARCAFRAIGREHRWSQGRYIDFLNNRFMHTGNPISTSTTKMIRDLIHNKNNDSKKQDKMGPAVSLGVVVFHILAFMKQCIEQLNKNLQASRIINTASLALLLAFCMHEGNRPGEAHRQLRHRDLFFIANKKIYWLTLVFLKPKTLAYLLRKYKLKNYVVEFFKGKKMQNYKPRHKATIPVGYNALDLPTLYVIFMRIILNADANALTPEVFKSINYADVLNDRLTALGYGKFVFYSIRCAMAEEDKKYEIPGDWTRYCMGHSEQSDQKDQYAENKDERVVVFGETCHLGADLRPNESTSNVIKLECNPITGSIVYKQKWKLTPSAREEIEEVNDLVTNYLEMGDEDSLQALKSRFISGDFKKIPLGFNFTFPANTFPEKMKERYDENVEYLHECFKAPECTNKVEVWSWTQTRYGNWSALATDEVIEQTITPAIVPPPKKRRQPELTEGEWDFIPQNIDVGNYIILISDKPDKYSLKVPEITKKVWVAMVTEINKKTLTFKGKFYYNDEKDITKPLTKTMLDKGSLANERMIVGVYEEEGDLDLTEENIQDITKYIEESGK